MLLKINLSEWGINEHLLRNHSTLLQICTEKYNSIVIIILYYHFKIHFGNKVSFGTELMFLQDISGLDSAVYVVGLRFS